MNVASSQQTHTHTRETSIWRFKRNAQCPRGKLVSTDTVSIFPLWNRLSAR